jgi:membrane associated rhomboid family serine protease
VRTGTLFCFVFDSVLPPSSCPAGKVGLVYLISGVGGSVLSVLFIRNGVSVGASGALFGLLGAMLSELITNWTIYSNRVPSHTPLLS